MVGTEAAYIINNHYVRGETDIVIRVYTRSLSVSTTKGSRNQTILAPRDIIYQQV